jgi:D-aminoacyl-tRNA deacylase
MTVLLISSSEDPASTNIKNSLLNQTTWTEQGTFYDTPVYQHTSLKKLVIVTIPDKKIRHEDIDIEIHDQLSLEPRLAIFLSRHRSKMEEPSLTVHPIGNYAEAEFGGKPRTLVLAAPRMMTHLLRLIKKNLEGTTLPYKVCFEVTHHGPYLQIPTFFAEVGSTETQWRQPEPAAVIAQSLLELFHDHLYEDEYPHTTPVVLGIGGGHYAPRFTEVAFQKNVAFGHMIASYHIDAGTIDWEMLDQSLRTTPDVHGVYLHKKALKKSQVTEYKRLFEQHDIPVLSSNALPALQ